MRRASGDSVPWPLMMEGGSPSPLPGRLIVGDEDFFCLMVMFCVVFGNVVDGLMADVWPELASGSSAGQIWPFAVIF